MIASIHQPAYLPWLGYFDRIARSGVHVVLDHVQFEKNSFINRNRIRTSDGWCWLTVPVRTHGRFGELPISAVEIDNTQHWAQKHWRSIAQNYSHTPYFRQHAPFFERAYAKQWTKLVDLCGEFRDYLLSALRVDTPMMLSSVLEPAGAKAELVLNICRTVGADTYFSGALGRDYLNEAEFRSKSINVVFQDYAHPTYPQQGRGAFVPNLSAIDLLFNCGPASFEIMQGLGTREQGNQGARELSKPARAAGSSW